MNSESVDLRLELRETIDLALLGAPVVLGPPVLDQFLQVSEIGAVLPTSVGNLVGKTRAAEASTQVGEHFDRHLDAKRFDLSSGHLNLRTSCGFTSELGVGIKPKCYREKGFSVNRYAATSASSEKLCDRLMP